MSLADVEVTLIDSVDEASNFLRWLSTKDRIAFDTETTGLNWQTDRVRLVQFGDEQHGWVIPFERWGGVVEDVANRYEGIYDAHNAPYDYVMLNNEGIEFPRHRIHDTRLMAHVLDSTGSLALKNLAKRHVDSQSGAGQHLLEEAIGGKGGWTWATVPITFEPYWMYAGLDTVLTSRLRATLLPRVEAEAPKSYDLELAVAWVCARMQRHRGVRIDREYTQKFSDELEQYLNDAETWCKDNYNCKPGSSDAIIERLRNDNVDLVKRTASGARYSLDKEVLEGIDHPLAKTVLEYRQTQKILSTYLHDYLRRTENNEFIYPSINTVGGTNRNPYEPGGGKGVRTGRMSMDDPNLQNVPIRTNDGARVRNCFIPRDGHTWIKCDADQIEMRVLTYLSQDPKMVEAFLSDDDFFTSLARDLFNDPDFTKEDPRRQLVKNGSYAKAYGAGIAKFAATAKVDENVANAFMQKFDITFPQVKSFIRRVERTALHRRNEEGEAYVRSPLTGRRHACDPGKEYTLVNYLVQGLAGELLKMKIVEADAAGLGEYMLFPVHDEIDMDVPTDIIPDVVDTLRTVMNDADILNVPLTWSVATGDRWGNVKDIA